MAFYRLYYLDGATGRIDRHEQFEAEDDDRALEIVGPHLGNQPLELWTGGRKVGHFDDVQALYALAPGGAWAVRDRPESPDQPRRIFSF